jgi:sigma-54 dependent transcriptional regulator, acetoin dehydrogenase operon transcriptional activator AcoR
MGIPPSFLIPRTSDEQLVASSWEHFVHDGPLPGDSVRDVVLDSWRRCRSRAVDPQRDSAPVADSEQIDQLRDRARELYEASQPVLEALREVLCESGSLIMLTDPTGTILDLHGESRARNAGERINLAPGGRWVEEVIGTNAIGTAIATRQPVQLYASEHYCIDVKGWTCAAAPVLDRSGKNLLGVIDVSGVKETFHGHTLGLVIAAAKQIEAVLARREADLHGCLLEQSLDGFARYANDCVILFDRHGRVVKSSSGLQQARELHGVCLPFEPGAQVAAFNLGLPPAERLLQAPGWLRPEWLHPVRSREGELGTLLVIPLAAASARPVALPLRNATVASEADADPFAEIIGSGEAIAAAKARARRVAPLDLPVLLLGETGVGKEVFARAIHKAGVKPKAPFIAVNCGALTRELLASELFGYAEGAFTGARRGGLPGKFELADGGTLFLDEIGEMPLDMQPHLLRVLQDGIVVRLGDTRERRVAVRLITATNRDLRGEVTAGRFREDLYHRLCVVGLRLPALRERPDDIPAIVANLNTRLARKYGCPPKTIDAAAHVALSRYRWPGNIRELQNVFEAMFAMSDGETIDAALLPSEIATATGGIARAESAPTMPISAGRLHEMEQQAVLAAVANAQGNLSMAARNLGISRSTLYVKLAAIRARPGGSH